MNIENLFPTPVAFFKYNNKLTNTQLDFINNTELIRHENVNSQSVNRYVLKHNLFTDLNSFILNCVNEYFFEIYKPLFDVKPYITQSWLNITNPGDHHHYHSHQNSLISGVFYIDCDPNVDKIYFSRPETRKILDIYTQDYNIYNSTDWYFFVNKCDLILFPSTLFHDVRPVEQSNTRKRRISLAFNTFVEGYLGNEARLTSLHLVKDNPTAFVQNT